MSKNVPLLASALPFVLADLADAARLCAGQPQAASSICTAVANLIAGTGTYGSTAQLRVMDACREAGFIPEYYVNSIRVTFGG